MRQLNEHIDELVEPIMRMILVPQECGMLISELLTLNLNYSSEAQGGLEKEPETQ